MICISSNGITDTLESFPYELPGIFKMLGPFKMKTTISRKILNVVNGVGVQISPCQIRMQKMKTDLKGSSSGSPPVTCVQS